MLTLHIGLVDLQPILPPLLTTSPSGEIHIPQESYSRSSEAYDGDGEYGFEDYVDEVIEKILVFLL
jgi:hypothetical protein